MNNWFLLFIVFFVFPILFLLFHSEILYFEKLHKEDIENILYNSPVVKVALALKIIIQFFIGGAIIVILFTKGVDYLSELVFGQGISEPVDLIRFRQLDVFNFVGKALGVSAGIELAYMLFTDGPDEAISPLIMAVASGAFFSISESPHENDGMIFYAVSLLVLLYALHKSYEWGLVERKQKKADKQGDKSKRIKGEEDSKFASD